MALHASGKNEPLDAVERVMRSGSDVVREQEDGLVYPGPQGNDSVWNGALMLPLAPFLFDITDNMHDWYQEQKAAGRNVPEPYFLTVPKGGHHSSLLLQVDWLMLNFYLRISNAQYSFSSPGVFGNVLPFSPRTYAALRYETCSDLLATVEICASYGAR